MIRKAGLLMLGIAAMAMTGCSSNSTDLTGSGLTTDQVNVQTSIVAAPEIATDGSYDTSAPSDFSVAHVGGAAPLNGIGSEGGPEGERTPQNTQRRWWRVITGRTTSFDYEFTEQDSSGRPTAAHITVHKHFTGTLHLLTPEVLQGVAGDSVVQHESTKPLADHWVRHLWLARVSPALNHGRPWRLVSASGVNVTSEIEGPGTQPVIQSIRVQAGEADSTFSDPAVAIHWNKLWCATPGTPVTITVTTGAPDDIVVLMHRETRAPLTANGDNTYTGTWYTPGDAGLKHFGINAISAGTLGDPASAYHSNAWLFPYINRGEAYGAMANDGPR